MAILDDLPGVEVTVQVDGTALEEYGDTDEEEPDKTVTRYVEAATSKEFTIHVKIDKGFKLKGDSFVLQLFVDSDKVKADGVFIHETRFQELYTYSCVGYDDRQTITKFKFNELETVSDGRKLSKEASKVEHLGVLKVRLYHAKMRNKKRAAVRREIGHSEVGIVSEKALKGKAVSHSVGTGATIASDTTVTYKWDGVGPNGGLAATFDFRYRSREALQSMLIIPRTPSPPPLEDKDPADLTADDIKELLRRAKEAKELEDTKRKIKRERKDENPRPRKISRPSAGDTQLELDDEGSFRESSTATLDREEPEVIELD